MFRRHDHVEGHVTAEDPKPPEHGVLVALITATLTTIATGLATWGVEELRAKFGSKRTKGTDDERGRGT